MARRRKTRTHNLKGEAKPNDGSPKSFVVHTGTVGSSVKALSRDVRRVLEPNTATRLRERKSNKIKDFIAMSGPLHVTHLLVFNQSDANTNAAEDDKEDPTSNVNLRITRLPRGPTLGFKVLRYALVRDILNATKRPRSPGKEFNTEPILILNNFSATNNTNDARQLTLMQTMFQNLFPPIKVHSMPLSNARRVVLLSYNPTTRTLDFRHYLITIRPVGVSRAVRKIIEGTSGRKRVGVGREGSVYSAAASDVSSQSGTGIAGLRSKGLPDLSNAQDISDYILNHGDMGFLSSASEAESDASGDENGESTKQVELSSAYLGRGNKKLSSQATENGGSGEKRAVKLTELGPRLELGLVKIEDGIGDGKGEVLFHEFIHKSAKEVAEINRRAKEKEKLAKERRAIQEANVKRKKEEKEKIKAEKAAKKKARIDAGEQAQEGDDEEEEDEEDEEESDNDEFEYEDMFAEGQNGQSDGDNDEFGNDDDQELFDEDSEEESEEEQEDDDDDDDSDLSPVAIDSSQSEDEGPAPLPQRKKFKPAGRGGRGGSSRGGGGRGATHKGGRGGKPGRR